MQLFVDTAKLSEIREAMGWGVVDGVTTNPSLLRAAMEAVSYTHLTLPTNREV